MDNLTMIINNLANIAIVIGAPISIAQLVYLRLQRKEELKRTKCEETMNAWEEIKEKIITLISATLEGLKLDTEDVLKKKGLPEGATTWSHSIVLDNKELHQTVKQYLSTMERFSVGINFCRYDIDVFDRLYGQTTIKMHEVLTPYLTYVAIEKGASFYCDFEEVVKQLKAIRAKREQEENKKRIAFPWRQRGL